MSLRVTSNISQIIRAKIAQIEGVNRDEISRAMAFAVLPELKRRVHVEGKASDGSKIGTYSNAYMKIRTGEFGNSDRKKKGKSAGELKNAGTYTKGDKKGQARPKYNRSNDPTVILSLTRQMENDLSVVSAGSGYGIGFKNQHNYDKSQWNEQTYNRKIWNVTSVEQDLAQRVAEEEVKNHFKSEE